MNKERVMIVDALNMFLRAYIVDPSLSMNGDPIGGIKGIYEDPTKDDSHDTAVPDCNCLGRPQWVTQEKADQLKL